MRAIERADALLVLAAIQVQQAQTKAAMASYREAVELVPGLAEGWFNLGQLLRAGGETDAAAAALDRAVAAAPQDRRMRLAQMELLRQAGRWRAARDSLQQAVAAVPGDRDLQVALLELLAASPDAAARDGALALKEAQRLAVSQRDPRYIELTAMALAELGEYQQAAELIAQLIAAPQTAAAPAQVRDRLQAALARYRSGQPWRLAAQPVQQ